MPRKPSAKPERFKEAIEAFRRRVIMPADEFDQLEAEARTRAFKVSGVAHLDVIADVWKAIDGAIENGTTLADFKADVAAKLEAEWGRADSPRLETIFRTNVQAAYSAGRWSRLENPDVREAYPYRRFSAIMDARTSPYCSPINGTILPAADPFWRTHVPPLHFRCRSGIEAISEEEAGQLGVANRAPDLAPQGGFGAAPASLEWEPDLTGKPAALVNVFRSRYGGKA